MNQSKCRSHFVISIFLCFILPCLAGCKKKDMSLKLNEPRNIKGVVSYKPVSYTHLTLPTIYSV